MRKDSGATSGLNSRDGHDGLAMSPRITGVGMRAHVSVCIIPSLSARLSVDINNYSECSI